MILQLFRLNPQPVLVEILVSNVICSWIIVVASTHNHRGEYLTRWTKSPDNTLSYDNRVNVTLFNCV